MSSLTRVKHVTADRAAFLKHLAETPNHTVLKLTATWCGPCKQMAPEFEKAARALEPHVRFAKLDTEAAPNEAAAHGIRSIPTLVLFRKGQEIARQSGAMDAGSLLRWVRSHA